MPADTAAVLDAAKNLGALIADHPVMRRYADAQKALTDDAAATKLFTDFDARLAKLGQQEQAGQPVTAQQRADLQALQQSLASNLKVKAFSLAQVELTDLLRQASQTWQRPVAEAQNAGKPKAGAKGDGGGSPFAGGTGGGGRLVMPG